MKLFAIYLCVLVVQECRAYFYPPVIWHSQNCVFRQLKETYGANKTKEFFMKVLPHNGVNIVCPNDMAVNDWLGNQLPDRMYENMWMVDKHGYDNCMVNDKVNPKMNKMVLLCDDPTSIKYETFALHNKFNNEEPMFAPGHHYYFISTSYGEVEHLNRKKGGHCKDTFMKLHIYVCDPKREDCIWEIPDCSPPYEMEKLMKEYSRSLPPPTRAPVIIKKTLTTVEKTVETSASPKPATTRTETFLAYDSSTTKRIEPRNNGIQIDEKKCQDEKEEGTSIHMILNFVLGGVILFMAIVIVILACGLARRSGDKGRPTSVAFSAIAQEPSTHLYEETARFVHVPTTPLSKSPPLTPITMNPPFYLAPMSEIRPQSPPQSPLQSQSKYGFNNSIYNQRRHSYDATSTTVEASPMLVENGNTAAAV